MIESASLLKTDTPPIHSVTLGRDGPWIVILHGWGRSLEALRPLGDLLADHHRVLLIDLPGFGNSPLPSEASNEGNGWGTTDYCERVRSFLKESGIDSYTLIGHSFGGRISVRLAASDPDAVTSLVLIGAAGIKRERPPVEELRIRCVRSAVSVAKWVDGTFGTRFFPHYLAERFGSQDYKAAGELRKTFVKTVNEDLSVEAAKIKAPTLLVWGEHDSEAPVDIARAFHARIKGSELVILPRKGHEPFSDVGAHLVCSLVERFLGSRRVRAR